MKAWSVLAILAASACLTSVASAGESCCAACGCQCECQLVCRLKCETKEVTKVTWSCKCEDFCLPGPSTRCKECGTDDCGCPKKTYSWIPGCAQLYTKKVPVKHEEKIKKQTYKWVVERVCPKCASCASQGDALAPPVPTP